MRIPSKTKLITSGLSLLLTIVMAGCAQNPQANGNADNTDKPGLFSRILDSPKPVTVPEGTDLTVVLDQSISTAANRSGESFKATLASPIVIDGKTVIPKHASVTGHIVDAQASGRLKGVARLDLALDAIEVDGKSYDIATSDKGRVGRTTISATAS